MFNDAVAPATEKSINQAAAKGASTFSNAVLKSSMKFKKHDDVIYDRLHMGLSRRARDGKKSQQRRNVTESTERRYKASSVDGHNGGASASSPMNSQRNMLSTATRNKEQDQNIEIIGGRLSPLPRVTKSKAIEE